MALVPRGHPFWKMLIGSKHDGYEQRISRNNEMELDKA